MRYFLRLFCTLVRRKGEKNGFSFGLSRESLYFRRRYFKNKMKKEIALGFMSVFLLASCQEKKQERPAAVYQTMKVELSSQDLESEYSATMTGKEIVEIRPQVQGLITRICIQEGQKVRRGQTLFQIDPVPYQAALDNAVASVEAAKAKLASAELTAQSRRDLFEKQVVSEYDRTTAENELAAAKASLAQAQAQERSARNSLSYTQVKSPVDGVAGMIPYHVGALVSSSISEPLVTVSDDSDMYVYFSISERQCTDLLTQFGSMDAFAEQMPPVKLKMSNGDMYSQTGRVDAVSGIVEDGTGSVKLRATFPNPDRLLRNGGSSTVILFTHRDSIIVVPQKATYELQSKVFAYRIVDGKTKSTPLEVFRLNNGTEYVVESGLQPGDEIIAEGAGLLKEGIEVGK